MTEEIMRYKVMTKTRMPKEKDKINEGDRREEDDKG